MMFINNQTLECPNHIFNIQDEQSVVIDGFSYRHETTHISSTLGRFEVPMRLNLYLNIPREEFHSFTTGKLQEMEENKRQQQRRKIKAELIKEQDTFSLFNFGGILHSMVSFVGGYVAVAVLIFILYLIISARLQRRSNA